LDLKLVFSKKKKATELARAIDGDRRGQVQIHVINEADNDADTEAFFNLLGGRGPIAPANEGGDDANAEAFVKKLFRLSDAGGFTEVASGNAVKRNLLESSDVFIVDSGAHVFAWVGKNSSQQERRLALGAAQQYLAHAGRPAHLPISRILEGGENDTFEHSF